MWPFKKKSIDEQIDLVDAKRWRFVREHLLNLRWDLITIKTDDGSTLCFLEDIRLLEKSNAAHALTDAKTLTERLDALMDKKHWTIFCGWRISACIFGHPHLPKPQLSRAEAEYIALTNYNRAVRSVGGNDASAQEPPEWAVAAVLEASRR